ncbi:MAG: dihydroorotase [Bacteroidota bacterium]
MSQLVIKNARIVNRGQIIEGDILVNNQRIEKIAGNIPVGEAKVLEANGQLALPGIVDDQVHFREPGLTHKGEIYTEARAAVAGGVTSYMEMPNVKPPTLTQELLQAKYDRAAACSLANYSFYMGASNENIEEVLKTDPKTVCGLKIFMGSSTGNMLVDSEKTLDNLFSKVPMLIATHCEDEATIRANAAAARERFGENVPMEQHPIIRSVEGCLKSSSMAVELAKKHGTRLHILHISTKDELDLFRNDIPLEQKRITAEVCVHHLFFNADDYAEKGSRIKWNPAVKAREHQEALFPALLDNRLDVIATDHAPHLPSEKANPYFSCPSGGPLIQHTLNVMLDFYHRGMISLERIVEKMCHAPAVCYQLAERGYLDEGKYADIVLVDEKAEWTVAPDNILYKCGYSPFEGYRFRGKVMSTLVSGHLAYHQGRFDESQWGQRLTFAR